MKKTFYFAILVGTLSLLFAGCTPSAPTGTPIPEPPTPVPTATPVKVHPTPSSPGDWSSWQNLQIRMEQAEITDSFVSEFGSQRSPSPGKKFLWVQIQLKNNGETGTTRPALEHFSVIYAEVELKPTYGHRQGYPEYTSQPPTIFPAQNMDAWLRFDIPVTAELTDLQFVFLPESKQLGVLPSSPDYPWGGEQPVFIWECNP